MGIPDFTLVVGVDARHLRQLELVWRTWKRHKPSLLQNQMIVFHETTSTSVEEVRAIVDHPCLQVVPWPMEGVDWNREGGEQGDKFSDPHRAMMLSGFVYVPAAFVKTPYWLKLDTDVVATGIDDWVDSDWFRSGPAIISHCWSYTKPANQMILMDRWVSKNQDRMPPEIGCSRPLELVPKAGWSRVNHKRIISWCGFFDTAWTKQMAILARQDDGVYKLPVPSQDGYLWYMATRCGRNVVRPNMKRQGFQHWSAWRNILFHSEEAMQ